MISEAEVYDAFKEAGASEQSARKAAEAIAAYDNRFVSIEGKLTDMQRQINLMKWMLGTNILLTIGVLGGLLFVPPS